MYSTCILVLDHLYWYWYQYLFVEYCLVDHSDVDVSIAAYICYSNSQ